MNEIETEGFSPKAYYILIGIIAAFFLGLTFRLYYLQILKGERYLTRSESNFIQEIPVSHSRGLIFDRHGQTLVDNRPSHDVYVTVGMLPHTLRELKAINEHLKLSGEDLKSLAKAIDEASAEASVSRLIVRRNLLAPDCTEIEMAILDKQIKGVYLDRHGDMDCDLLIDPMEFPSQNAVFAHLEKKLGIPHSEMKILVEKSISRARMVGRFKPIPLMRDIDFEIYASIESAVSLGLLPGIAVFDAKRRRYIHGAFASHALGFLNEVSLTELKDKRLVGYRGGDRIGRRGVESIYETKLKGIDGIERFIVDAKGRRYNDLLKDALLLDESRIEPVPGQNLMLTLDYKLQKAVESTFKHRAGSVIAMDVHTGAILAMASFPDYDPNKIISRDNRKIIKVLSENPDRPWVNKVVQEHYAPGSTFKPFTALAALESGIIEPNHTEVCSGSYRIGKTKWRCFKRDGHGALSLSNALKKSCDSFFYELATKVGPDQMAKIARNFGFGLQTGIDLEREITGIIPDKSYYQKRFGYFAPGFVVNQSIGQGDVAVTPIQLAVAYAAIVNGGNLIQPHLLKGIADIRGNLVDNLEPIASTVAYENSNHLNAITEALAESTLKGGSAYGLRWHPEYPTLASWLRTSGTPFGGKTGTAQVVKLSKQVRHLKIHEVEYLERDHAWFVGFAPIENPEIVVVAMTEHGGFGGRTSAPIAGEVIREWYKNRFDALPAKEVKSYVSVE